MTLTRRSMKRTAETDVELQSPVPEIHVAHAVTVGNTRSDFDATHAVAAPSAGLTMAYDGRKTLDTQELLNAGERELHKEI